MNTAIDLIKKVRRNVASRRAALPNHIVETPNGPGYTIRGPEITSRTVTFHTDFSKIVLPSRLPAGFKSIEGRVLLNQTPVCRVTQDHGIVGSPVMVNHWYFITLYGIAVVHRSGSVQVTSSGQIGKVIEKLNKIIPGVRNVRNIKISKIDGRIFLNRYLNLDSIAIEFSKKVPVSIGTVFYDSETGNRLQITWKNPAMTLILFRSGQVQVFGSHKPANVVDVFKSIVRRLGERTVFVYSRLEGGYAVKPPRAATKEEKLNRMKKSKLNARHPLVDSFNFVPPAGKYVRPGPNLKPRLYNIKTDMGLVTGKILKAYQAAGVEMPRYVANMVMNNPPLMLSAPGAKRAPSWNSRMNGFYVRPGPAKQPHFYKIPKDLKAGFKTAKKSYNDAGVTMPQQVKNIFGVTNESPSSGSPLRGNHTVNGDKVDGRQYTRLTVSQLVGIARNLGDAGVSNSMSKKAIFLRIKERAPAKSASPVRTPNVTVNDRVYIFSNDPLNQRIIRNGRKRVFSTLPKAEREAIARAYLGNNYSTISVKNWYNTMRAKKMFPSA
jgi:TATA-box binding protein (TBP) (component of TFIID and TFIIIB)